MPVWFDLDGIPKEWLRRAGDEDAPIEAMPITAEHDPDLDKVKAYLSNAPPPVSDDRRQAAARRSPQRGQQFHRPS